MAKISNLAFVHPEAKIAEDVIIGAFCYIDRNVEIGAGTKIHSHVSVLSGARIGKNNVIYEGAIISASPQDFRWKGEDSFVVIGDNNQIREQVIINRSIHKDGKTEVGSNSFIMAQSHIGHDSVIGNYCVLGNSVKIAGDVKIGSYSILSSHALVHENCQVGEWVLVKGGCRVNGHVPPFVVMAHNPISYYGVNAYVLKKANKTEAIIDDIAKCYRHVYQNSASVYNALRRIKEDIDESPERNMIVSFIEGHNMKLAALPQVDIDE